MNQPARTQPALPLSPSPIPPFPRSPVPPFPLRSGFSFIEILFALFVLGIGLVMVAGIFPVAIQQTQLTLEESTARTITESGRRYVEAVMTQATEPTGTVALFTPQDLPASSMALSQAASIAGSRILASDPRFAWVPFYRRVAGSPSLEVFILPIQCRNALTYNPAQLPTLRPFSVLVQLRLGANGAPGQVVFPTNAAGQQALARAAEGAFVLMRNTGKYYRLGNPAIDPTQPNVIKAWEVDPTLADILPLDAMLDVNGAPIPGQAIPRPAYILGRGLRNPALAWQPDPSQPNFNPFEGPAQEVRTSFIGPFPVTPTR